MIRTCILSLLACATLALPVAAVTIDHSNVDETKSLPQSSMDEIGKQRWFFAHASVGWNMVGGIGDLNDADPARHQLVVETVTPGSPPPASTADGSVYESYRGNPGWAEKFAQFEISLRDEGWRYPAVDVVMNKLCYDDHRADATAYLNSMTLLEKEYPATVFVYTTMPLRTDFLDNNVRINLYNETVRAHCAANDKLLFDVADIEAHDPDGNEMLFEQDGVYYQMLYEGYTDDGGHLNELGRQREALGWYAVAAAINSGGVASAGDAPAARIADIASVVPNPFNPATVISWSLAADAHADLAVIDLRGRLVQQLFDGPATAGDHSTRWRGLDTTGRSVATGVYLVRLQVGNETSTRSMTLVR